MKAGSSLEFFRLLGEGDALVGDFLFKFLDGRDMPVDDWLVDQRPPLSFACFYCIAKPDGKPASAWPSFVPCLSA
jgi:hypothetical protein